MATCVESVPSEFPLDWPARERSAEQAADSKKSRWFHLDWLRTVRARRRARAGVVAHVKIDNFFASVEQMLNPALQNQPVLVSRGVVVSASREAEQSGVRAGMSLTDALLACPSAIVVPGRYRLYADFAERARQVLEAFAPVVESADIDSFYIRITDAAPFGPDFEAGLQRVQAEILGRTGLSVSIGAGRSKAVAAVASSLECPHGLRIVPPGDEEAFLAPLGVEKLRGISDVDIASPRSRGITTIGQLRRIPKGALAAAFGPSNGERMWALARGLDRDKAMPCGTNNSLFCTVSLEGGTSNAEFFRAQFEHISERLASQLRERDSRAISLGVQLRYADGFTARQVVRPPHPVSSYEELSGAANGLLTTLFTHAAPVHEATMSVICSGSTRATAPSENDAADRDGTVLFAPRPLAHGVV